MNFCTYTPHEFSENRIDLILQNNPENKQQYLIQNSQNQLVYMSPVNVKYHQIKIVDSTHKKCRVQLNLESEDEEIVCAFTSLFGGPVQVECSMTHKTASHLLLQAMNSDVMSMTLWLRACCFENFLFIVEILTLDPPPRLTILKFMHVSNIMEAEEYDSQNKSLYTHVMRKKITV